jgi:hypothetical protein
MMISTCRARPSHDAALSDGVRATPVLACAADDGSDQEVPNNCQRRGNVLFGASAMMTGGRARLDALAEHHLCDAVDVMQDGDGSIRYGLGVRLHWKMLWHDHAYRLWRPRTGAEACFVSADPAHAMWFRIADGRLEGWQGDLPWNDAQERLIGLRLGAAALRRLAGGR